MKILILGGTKFLGRHLTEAALKAGHEVTLFNRGTTNPGLFPSVERIQGDRDGGLDGLKGRKWDVAIDTCGYIPRIVKASAELLADQVEHYTFISSISVYDETLSPNEDENGPLIELEDPTVEAIMEYYGGLKVLCERAAPGKPEHPVQFIDGRDQAAWILRMAEARKAGVYNVTGPEKAFTMGELLQTCQDVAKSGATLTWVSDDFLVEQGVTPYTEMPLWIPESYNAIQTINIGKALKDGLTFRSVTDIVRDTLQWNAGRTGSDAVNWSGSPKPRAGMMQERERELLDAWKQKA